MLRNLILAAALLSASLPAAVIYDNLNPTGSQLPFTPAPAAPTGALSFTGLLADDITPLASSTGWLINQIELNVTNSSTSDIPTATGVYFWAPDGPSGGPGTVLFAGVAATVNLPPGNQVLLLFPGAVITAPRFWLGFNFSNYDDRSVLPSTLNQLRLGVNFSTPPSVGSTAAGGFFSSTAQYLDIANPAGIVTNNVNNLSLRIYGDPLPTPEPATLFLTGFALLTLGCSARRRV